MKRGSSGNRGGRRTMKYRPRPMSQTPQAASIHIGTERFCINTLTATTAECLQPAYAGRRHDGRKRGVRAA